LKTLIFHSEGIGCGGDLHLEAGLRMFEGRTFEGCPKNCE
jgi:hypothetical protein